MRIAFLGTATFSVASLVACVEAGHDVAVVVTQPDRPGDRGRPAPRPVADVATRLGIPLQQPERLRRPDASAALLALEPDALVVAAYGQILPATLLDAPRFGGVNVHASLLPRWRGAAPVNAAIRAGDEKTGVAIMRMEAGLDTGPVYAMEATPIGRRETAPQLTGRLAHLGAALLVTTLAAIEAGTQPDPTAQDDRLATLAPRLTRDDGAIGWDLTAAEVDRAVRGLQPWPGVTAPLAGEAVRILAGEPVGPAVPHRPGTITGIEGTGVLVACRDGRFRVDALQPAGRRAMDAASWLRGRRLALPAAPD